MKKVISMLCVLLLFATMTVAVSAAAGTAKDPYVCTNLQINMIKIPAGATYYVSFTDDTGAAKRQISVNSSAAKDAGYIVTYGDTVEASDENGFCNINAVPDANNTYLFTIQNNATKQANFFVSFNEIAPYELDYSTALYEGENVVATKPSETTLFVFEPEDMGVYEVCTTTPNAIISYWNGSAAYVSDVVETSTSGKLEITCQSIGQSLLIGLSGVDSANLIITRVGDYIPEAAIEYVDYVNKHTPVSGFARPETELSAVDITAAQAVVLGADGIYRLGSANGPVMYVDMNSAEFVNLYECYYPSDAGAMAADRMRGTYEDENGKKCGYEFLTAMKAYADALDADGFYYLTEDLANYIRMYGGDQGWFISEFSPFTAIKEGNFTEESAWLVSAYYDPDSAGEEPIVPDQPDTPDHPDTPDQPTNPDEPDSPDQPNTPDQPDKPSTPDDPDDGADSVEPENPATGVDFSFAALAVLLMATLGSLTFCKKRI